MVTIYELLQIEEDASKEEIEKAYSRLVYEFRQDIKFDAEKNKENEMIINRLKLAYEILIDDEKRKKYDYQLAQKRAENLIENVSIQEEKDSSENIYEGNSNQDMQSREDRNELKKDVQRTVNQQSDNKSEILTNDEKKEIRQAAQKEFQEKLRKAKMAEREYVNAYNKAYNEYIKKNGYADTPFKRLVRTVMATFIVILICFIVLNLPPVKNWLTQLFEENFVLNSIKELVNSIIK